MAKSPPAKKRKPQAAADPKILPTELQVGDRLADDTGEWEVIAAPYSTAGGGVVHARVQRIGEAGSWEIRSWGALEPIGGGLAGGGREGRGGRERAGPCAKRER